jgi:PASTA domain
MNEPDTVELLQRLADTVEVGQAPVERIAADGRRRERERRRWQIAGAAVAVSILVATGTFIARGNAISAPTGEPADVTPPSTPPPPAATFAVPNVKGLSENVAVQVLEDLGFVVQLNDEWTCDPSDPCPADLGGSHIVVSQDPAPGTRQPAGAVVTVRVEPVVPDLSQEDIRAAQLFAAFARDETGYGPFDTPVGLGVQGSFVKAVSPTSPAGEWEVPPPAHSGISGTLSALRIIKQYDRNLQVTSDRQVVCATKPATGQPELTGGGHLVSIQPGGSPACLQWFSVDLYVNDVSQVVGVDVRVGTP